MRKYKNVTINIVLMTNLSTMLATMTEEFWVTQKHLLTSLDPGPFQDHSANIILSVHLCNLKVTGNSDLTCPKSMYYKNIKATWN